jgi:uncharacterized membrane protein YdbT with pleckstrin-like domain
MSYVSQTLADDESIIERANFNWTYSFWEVFFLILGFLPLVGFVAIQSLTDLTLQDLRVGYWAGMFSAACGVLIALFHAIHLWTTEIVVTTFRFVYKTGLVSRDTKEVSLNKIEEISLKQTVFGRLFGYGQLVLRGTGVGVIELPNIDNPIQLRRTIETAKSNLRKDSSEDRRTNSADAELKAD